MRAVDAVRSVLLAVIGLGLAACGQPRALDYDVANGSADGVLVELVAGLDGAPADGRDVLTSGIVGPGERVTSRSEEPGAGGWTLYINRERVADSRRWVADAPMDFVIDIGLDGRVHLVDD